MADSGLYGDARLGRLRDLHRQAATIQQPMQRLIDAYTAQVLTLDELGERRTRLEARRANVQREWHDLEAAMQQEVQLTTVATQMEQFRSVSAAVAPYGLLCRIVTPAHGTPQQGSVA